MTDWRPSMGAAVAARRAEILQRLRSQFEVQQILEVDTPSLSAAAVSDVHIESLEVRSKLSKAPLFLHTSPEFCMKRMLAADYPDIYSICRVFRDGEYGSRHQPEFTMLEWYRRNFGLQQIIQDSLQVIAVGLDQPAIIRSAVIIDYRDLFQQTVGIDPLTASVDALANSADADHALRKALGENRDDWLDLLLSSRIVPEFADGSITVVRHYPASQATLARLCPANPTIADRFEVYVGKLELANGYVEMTDADTLAERFAADQQERQRRGRPQRPSDEALIAAQRSGLPPCAGVALGIERLHMILENSDHIHDVVPFPFETSL